MDTGFTDGFLPPIDFQDELNEEQFAAVSAPFGPALVLAGAGSGKTRTLTYRVAWLLHKNVQPWKILLLTFTNKAAREMLERVEDLTGVPRTKFWGGTFHSIGQRLLRRYGVAIGLEANFTILDQSDAESLLSEVIRTEDAKFTKEKENPKPKAIADTISFARNTCRPVEEVAEERYGYNQTLVSKVTKFANLYEARKRKQNVCDYDDLLELMVKLLDHPEVAPELTARFEHLLVDEYQDTNTLQAKIIDKLAPHHRIMAVGDDAQCIYTWRGANIENILDFPERHPETEIFKIETNYRSTPEILTFANDVLQDHVRVGFDKELRAVREPNQKPYLIQTMDATGQAHFLLKRITGLMDEGYRLSDIAILYRAHYQSMDVQMELSRASLPYMITSGVRFFEQAHIRDLTAQLRFAMNPTDEIAFIRVVSLLPRVGPRTAANLIKLAQKEADKEGKAMMDCLAYESVLKKVPADAKEDYKDFIFTLQNLIEAIYGSTKKTGQVDLFDTQPENETEVDPLPPDQVVQLAIDGWYGDYLRQVYPKNWQNRRDDLDSLVGFAARYDTMDELLAQLVLLNSETSDRSVDPNEDAVRMTTIHQAKGLEYPIVFLIGMADGLFPLKRAIEEGDLDEERRLFYVGATRAKDELYLSYPRIQSQGGPPALLEMSRFIQAINPEHYEALRSSRPY